jgi:hypothetical protein
MTEEQELEQGDSFAGPEPKSSASVLAALRKAEDAFREWQVSCDVIDRIYGRDGYGPAGRQTYEDGFAWQDSTLDLFWASFEILKPAVYARPPQPVVAPLFKDGKPVVNTAAELLERCAVSVFKRTGIDDVMLLLRDDLIFAGRGSPWVRYEAKDDKREICVEHKDRLDFLHEPARKWAEVGWAAGAAWLTRKEMRKRFHRTSGDAYQRAKYSLRQERDDTDRDLEKRAATRKAKVWEVWHKADNKVYWVTDGVEVLLDEGAPHLDLTGFFPCPKPAYATLRRRSLIPVPDYERYAPHFDKISELTRRIYSLLNSVKMKGLIPGGGDVADAIEQLIRDDSDEILIPVPGASLLAQGQTGLVTWFPLKEIAEAIQGLIAARAQLIQDFYQLSGISDIMRGATEAEETLGAQELKSQYGSVRVREKSAELQRVAADTVKIAAEIIADKFPKETLLELSQMDIPSRRDIEKRIEGIEKAAKAELEDLAKKAKEMAGQQREQVDPAQAQQMIVQAQQEILARYSPMLTEAEAQVPIEDVMKLLRDDRTRSFVFEIESSSTILTDELTEKRSRNEFLSEFAGAQQSLAGLAAMGEPGAKLAGALMKFCLAPYRAGRELDGAIDEFIDQAPAMAKAAAAQGGESADLAEANKKLAEAEMQKAQAAMASVQARAALDKAEMQRRMLEMQQKAQEGQFKAAAETEKLRQSLSAEQARTKLIEAQINKLTADTAKILSSIGLDERKQELSEYQAAEAAQARQADQALNMQNQERDAEFRERGEERADRQQDFTEQTYQPEQGA